MKKPCGAGLCRKALANDHIGLALESITAAVATTFTATAAFTATTTATGAGTIGAAETATATFATATTITATAAFATTATAATAAAAVAAATAAATFTTTTAATAAAIATTASTAETATASSGWACLHGTGFVDHHIAATQRLAIHAMDGSLGFFITAHFHEAEAFGTARVTFHHDFGTGDRPKFTKSLFQIAVSNRVRQVADVKFVAHEGDSSKHKDKSDGAPKTHSTNLKTSEGKRN
jgi:hypothetical protein